MVETMREVIKYKRFSFDLDADALTTVVDIHFHRLDSNSTEILAENIIYGKGAVFKSIFALMKSFFKEQSDESYLKLKETIESTPITVEKDSVDMTD